MRQITIDLSEPFEKSLQLLMAAPANDKSDCRGSVAAKRKSGRANHHDFDLASTADVKQVLRCLYEAAHGRQVETPIGLIPIAPPVAAFLKEEPLHIRTQVDFLLEALTRIIEMSSRVKERSSAQVQRETLQKPSIPNRARQYKRNRTLLTTSAYE